MGNECSCVLCRNVFGAVKAPFRETVFRRVYIYGTGALSVNDVLRNTTQHAITAPFSFFCYLMAFPARTIYIIIAAYLVVVVQSL